MFYGEIWLIISKLSPLHLLIWRTDKFFHFKADSYLEGFHSTGKQTGSQNCSPLYKWPKNLKGVPIHHETWASKKYSIIFIFAPSHKLPFLHKQFTVRKNSTWQMWWLFSFEQAKISLLQNFMHAWWPKYKQKPRMCMQSHSLSQNLAGMIVAFIACTWPSASFH